MHVTFVRKIPSFPGIFRVETASEVCYTVSEQAPCSLCHPHFSSVDKSYHACDGAYRTLHAARSIEPVGSSEAALDIFQDPSASVFVWILVNID